jgi:hypothetical protein
MIPFSLGARNPGNARIIMNDLMAIFHETEIERQVAGQ